MKLFYYDNRNAESIYKYARQLEGMSFQEILDEYEKSIQKNYINPFIYSDTMFIQEEISDYHARIVNKNQNEDFSFNERSKGQLGNLLEKYYFGYTPNSNQNADFKEAGIELKQTPIEKTKKGYRAGERLSITNISYEEPVEYNFFKSHVWEKIKLILLIHYLRDKSLDRLDYTIKFVSLFKVPEEDIPIIIQDYNTIISKIAEGKAHELSESDTNYLGACTKGATAEKSLRPQYYGNHTLAKKRNFCFKVSYMDYILQNYVLTGKLKKDNNTILKQGDLNNTTFEKKITSMINRHIGKTDKELCMMYNREYNNNKAQWNDLAFKMLGVKSNRAAEFEKANIVVKTIRIEENGKIKECMSFPPFQFKELVEEKWEDSVLHNYFDETRFLFVIYRKCGENYKLLGSQIWNMPYQDLNDTVCREWAKIQGIIKEGVRFHLRNRDGEIDVENNLPGVGQSEILHVRPHAKKSAYKLHNGFVKGNLKRDANELPDGEWMTTQSFWINNSYILSQINSEILGNK